MSEKNVIIAPNKYAEGKIYKLSIPGAEEFSYIGSTYTTLEERLRKHKYKAQDNSKYKFASSILFEEDNIVEVSLIEAYPCANKQELLARERYWLEKFPNAINKNTPIQTREERRKTQAEEALKRYHNLKESDPEEFKARADLHKEWIKNNQAHIAEYNAEYRPIRIEKEKLRYDAGYGAIRNARKKEKVKCDVCNKEMNKNSIYTHKKSVHPTPAPQ